jgi:hypothetical protein
MKHTILLFLALFFCGNTIFSQEKLKKSEKRKLVQQADLALETEEYLRAWEIYKRVLASDSKHETAGLNAAIAARRLNYPADSSVFLSDNLQASSLLDARYYLAIIKHHQKKFDEAFALLDKYKSYNAAKRTHSIDEINYLSGISRNAKNFIAHAHPATIKNIGANINSIYADYVPVIVPDESALYFTSKRPGQTSFKNGDNNYFEDVFVSYKQNGVWQKATALPAPVNSETNDGCVAISPDGQRMIVYRTSAENSATGDLYFTRATIDNNWEPLQIIGKEINSPFIENSACFSNDTNEIYFSSDRPGGLGGKDIYRIRKLPNGKWSQPYNPGSPINTAYDEDAPFLHTDGVTLYFSSKGHNTMGEYDVFKSDYNKEKNEYTAAENLGFPINDVGNDIFFVLSVDGQRGYYSSVKPETFGGMDIYEIDTRFGDNDLKVIHGLSVLEGNPGRATISLTDSETGELYGIYQSNAATGKFIMVVNPLKGYKAVIEADDHSPITQTIAPLSKQELSGPLVFNLKKKDAH